MQELVRVKRRKRSKVISIIKTVGLNTVLLSILKILKSIPNDKVFDNIGSERYRKLGIFFADDVTRDMHGFGR